MIIRNFKEDDYKDIFKNYSSDDDNLKYMLCKIHKNVEDAKSAVMYFITNPNIYAIEENDGSSKLLLKHGFKLDGIIREKYKDRNGIYHNIKVFTKLI